MEEVIFKRFCEQAGKLMVGQIRQLGELLVAMDARIDLLTRIDKRREAISACLHCGGVRLRRWGETRTGLQRLRCLTCLRTFSSATDSALDRIRLPEKFHQLVADMFADRPRSCRKLGEHLGLDKMTIWRWRHRVIRAMQGVGATELSGIVEADEAFFRESRKGSREWVNHQRNPSAYPTPPRLRWEDYARLKIRTNLPMKWQIPVLTMADRSGGRRRDVLPRRAAKPLLDRLQAHVGHDAVLCSDGDPAYGVFARRRGIPHFVLFAKTGPRVIDKAYHIQNINNLHKDLKGFMSPFRGPATKHLSGYTAWFIARLPKQTKSAIDSAWQRLLAV